MCLNKINRIIIYAKNKKTEPTNVVVYPENGIGTAQTIGSVSSILYLKVQKCQQKNVIYSFSYKLLSFEAE